jgi:hypothetical protein
MAEDIIVRRFPVFIGFGMPYVEDWLRRMASRGLHLKSYGRIFVRFAKGDPKDICYRLEPAMDDMKVSESEIWEYLQAFGWELTAKWADLFYVCRTEDPEAVELHTDPLVQAATFSRLERTVNNSGAAAVMSLLCGIWILGTTILEILENLGIFKYAGPLTGWNWNDWLTSLQLLPLLRTLGYLVLSCTMCFAAADSFFVSKTKKALLSGVPVTHDEPRRWRVRVRRLFGWFVCALFLLLVVFSGIHIACIVGGKTSQ